MRPIPMLAVLALCTALAGSALAQAPASPVPGLIDRAARAYEAGNCPEVLAALEAIPEPNRALAVDGVSHYRWGFCLAALRRPGAEAHYRDAAALLGEEARGKATRVEAPFYQVNALLNLGKPDDARAAAAAATQRWSQGTLTVAADDPTGWFQLAKLFRDAGNPQGALEPARRAMAAHAKGPRRLRAAYLERIADLALEQKDVELARQANEALGGATGPGAELREARVRIAAGDLAGAKALLDPAARRAGEAATDARYVVAALDRVLELEGWGLAPVAPAGAGASLALDDVRRGLGETARAASAAIDRANPVEMPKLRGPGTRPGPSPAFERELRDLQARFAGFLVEALRRGAPLQEWAVVDGYPQLLHNPWLAVFVQRIRGPREAALLP